MTDKPWFIDKTIQQAQYMNLINQATIPGQVKDFCRYIASKTTWRHSKDPSKSYTPCFASQDTIEIQMGRCRQYVTDAKKAALELGWVEVRHNQGSSDEIWPTIGENDPAIKPRVKRQRWARGNVEVVD